MTALQKLCNIITNGVRKIEAECATRKQIYPMLDDPYIPGNNKVQDDHAVEAAPVIAAAYQLIATLTNPDPYIFTWSMASCLSASLAVAGQGCVADILREAGPDGMHVKDIAATNNMDPDKLARILRLLASRHIFYEVSPDVFRNNRISSSLCTGKSFQEIQEKPLEKWDNTNGGSAMAEFVGTDVVKAAGFLVENLTDPDTSHSQEPTRSPFHRAFNANVPFHTWLQAPENTLRLKRLQSSMRSLTGYAPGTLPYGGFSWADLPTDSVVVDVGGGIGTVTMDIAARFKRLHFIVQDLPAVIAQGRRHWASTDPDSLKKGRVELQEHDFFEPQPVQGAAVYMARYILHNWSDAYCLKILKRLREAAGPKTKLVVMEQIMDHLSRHPEISKWSIPGNSGYMGPEPLLAYPVAVSGYTYFLDILMMCILNSQGRTVSHLQELLKKAGWKLDRVIYLVNPHPDHLVCSPI